MWQSAVAAFFGLQISKWMWVLLGCVLAALLGWLALSAHKGRKRKRLKGQMLRTALRSHPETVLVCLRSVQSDTSQVVQCVVQACRQASSPLRLRFAIVQEDTAEDVYVAIEDVVRHSSELFSDIDLLSHVRTMSVIRSNYMHAAGAWKTMYDDETVVVCADAWVEWNKAWDVTLVRTMAREARQAVLSAPSGGQYCALQRREESFWEEYELDSEAGTVSWPAVVGRPFAFETAKVADAVAVHHNFWAMHGPQFASLPVPAVHVPLYLVDVVLSDWLFTSGGCWLRTLPDGIFKRPPSSASATDDSHLSLQVPRSWDGRLHLSAAYLRHAGLSRVTGSAAGSATGSSTSSSTSSSSTRGEEHGGHSAQGGQSDQGGRIKRDNGGERATPAPPGAFVVTTRAQLGLTADASLSDEVVVKYGSQRAEQQQRLALQAAKEVD